MDMNEFEQWLDQHSLRGYWQREGAGEHRTDPAPRVGFRPYLWKWSQMSIALERAGELISQEQSFRRNIGYAHPDLRSGTCHTFTTGIQLVKPGEHPLAHRHTFGAMRFAIQGDGRTYTVVDGEAFPLESGDLITTPSKTWHDHENEGDAPTMWLDIVDPPIVSFLRLMQSELYATTQGKDVQGVLYPSGTMAAKAGVMRPTWLKQDPQPPPYWYPWAATPRLLSLLAEESGDPFDGICLRYLNPINRGPTIPTLSCEMQMLRPGDDTHSHRHTSTVVYHAFRGSGKTAVNEETFEWETGDTFVVPAWCTHHHQNPFKEPAYLFSISDRPTVEALGLYREEAV